ncbi:hypothetical protein [Dyadobacter arcticus]|uniref:Mannan endo-1,4-beta-mannosidase n=1 Tax=Dyadobacter arcticus TaxID=1078754 RepID=A0ABX0US79_9BACT|nr:hypothetical protein [Dyadobacter arcticus]NIJ54500.1 mannan endo-1,4-beta-mannosidase [Dyadobacter arcticus]
MLNSTQPSQPKPLAWIRVCGDAPYFETEQGDSWIPIGQNDAITWPDFQGLFRRKDVARVEGHMAYLAAHGITCIRMMMEYGQTENRYLEKPVGTFQPNMIQFWDDLFRLCEQYKIRVLLTPFDTFWMARRWKCHQYNALSGGPCKSKWQWLTDEGMIMAIKNRFTFFIERWGASGVIFGWDLWNEINPLNAGKSLENLYQYIDQISAHIREKEMLLYKKPRPQTVSVFAPLQKKHAMDDIIFRHPMLDFASTHFYQTGSIDYPRNVNAAAVTTGKMVKEALQLLPPGRPFLDTEHGPISYFRRRRRGLPEAFDDLYFLHMQWAHLAAGAAGGGMRWPYRYPHTLTHGMRRAQLNLAQFARLIDWQNFKRKNLNDQISVIGPKVQVFGCGDAHQAIVWILTSADESLLTLSVPGLADGAYIVHFWDTLTGILSSNNIIKQDAELSIQCQMTTTNLALAIRRQL